MPAVVRVLVVEDYEPFRRVLCSALQNASFEVVGEASDGFDGVQKAIELQPDLILLDVSMPKLNGIDAAKRILGFNPLARLIFVTQESSSDAIEECFHLGALGYIHKLRVRSDLLPAVEAVLKGKRFVSSSLGYVDLQAPPQHDVLFYSSEEVLLDGLSHFVTHALRAGEAVIVPATVPHQKSLMERLLAEGLDIAGAIRERIYIPVDTHSALSTFMVNDWPDASLFSQAARELIRGATQTDGNDRRAVVCGECAPILLAEGKVEASIEVERLWDEIVVKSFGVDTLCVYPAWGLEDQRFKDLCAVHSAVHYQYP